jgi:UDP-N-acetylglucosamine/UDP-N-acetylgalactosamine diphosphorylase
MDTKTLNRVRKSLAQRGQDQVFAFWGELAEHQREALLQILSQVDLGQVDRGISQCIRGAEPVTVPSDFLPAPFYPSQARDRDLERKYMDAIVLGDNLISTGKVAAFVVAGGQGTRLGFDGPKGDFPATPIKRKTLFGIFGETVLAWSKRHSIPIPWYIMTSPLNHGQTQDIFAANDYFGLRKDQVIMFQQGTLPNFDFEGHILMAGKDRIASSPDGHGGSLRALHVSGALADMKRRGIEYISYWQVDNPLINLLDPLFVGLHALDESDMSSKALKKTGPMEKLGNFCLVDGKVTVIEYSDLPEEFAHRRNPDGSLVFELGSIGIHVVSRSFVEKLNVHGFALPFHKAIKKIPHIDSTGRPVEPKTPNGVKLETFVFDALPLTRHSMILETVREEEFAPIKNASGVDSAESSREMMIERAARWLEAAGVAVPRTGQGRPDCVIEIAPSFAVSRQEVDAKRSQIPEIRPGDQVYLE